MDIKSFRSWFDDRFSTLVKEKIKLFSEHSPSLDVSAIANYALPLSSEGKRFRPFLIFSGSGLSKEEAEEHFLLFASVELLHIFALIHDDIMDKAETRHGVLCAHKKFSEIYGEGVSQAVAILLGDIVLVWAYDSLTEYTQKHPDKRDKTVEDFKQLVSEVTHGQILDVISPVQEPLSKDLIIQKMTLKTGRYSFVHPLRLGSIISNKRGVLEDFTEEFGVSLGIGFQLQDDLLDVVPQEQSGKTPFVDIESGQQTMISWYMHNEASEEHKREFFSFFGKSVPLDKRERFFELIKESGAITFVGNLANEYFEKARLAISKHIEEADRQKWDSIVSLVAERKK